MKIRSYTWQEHEVREIWAALGNMILEMPKKQLVQTIDYTVLPIVKGICAYEINRRAQLLVPT